MSTRKKLIDTANHYGLLVIEGVDFISVDAPSGMSFFDGLHAFAAPKEEGMTREQLFSDLLDRIGPGPSPCDEEGCEVCAEGISFDELHALYGGMRIAG